MRGDHQSIIGFTEAELGLFVAVVFLAMAVLHRPDVRPGPKQVIVNESELQSLRKDANEANAQRHLANELKKQLEESNWRLKALERAPSQKTLRSRAVPSCREKGIVCGDLFAVIIRGSDRFQVGKDTYDLDELINRFDPELKIAEKSGCKHSIRIYYREGISADELTDGINALKGYFYGGPSGPAPNG